MPPAAAAAVAALRGTPVGLPPGAARPPTIVLAGDSLTEFGGADAGGWATRLAAHYARRADVLVRGYAGYNSRWLLRLLPRVLAPLPDVRLVTLLVGSNDAVAASADQAVPLSEFVDNLARLVGAVRRAGAQPLLLSPPPVAGATWAAACAARGKGNGDGRRVALVRVYARAVVRVGERLRVPVVDLFGEMRARAVAAVGADAGEVAVDAATEAAAEAQLLADDGLHLGPAGHAYVFERVVEVVRARAPTVDADALPRFAPEWRELVGAAALDRQLGARLPDG